MKKIFYLLTVVFLCQSLYSQNKNHSKKYIQKDIKAKEILDKLSKNNKSYNSIYAKFSYTIKNKDAGINETQKGTLYIKGDKYKLTISDQEVISNGKKVYTFIADDKELQINWASEMDKENEISPSKIFTLYKTGFKYKYEGKKMYHNKLCEVVKLFPENADKPFHTVILYIKKSLTQIYAMQTKTKDGNTFTYNVLKFIPNKKFEDSIFKFDLNKAEEIIDFTK